MPPTVSADGNKASEFGGAQKSKLAAWVRQEYSKAKTSRSQVQSQWQVNMRFTRGEQWIQPGVGSQAHRTVTPRRRPNTPERKVINKTRQQFRSELSRYMQSQPNITGVPATSEGTDIRAAIAAEAVWEYLQASANLPFVLSDLYVWLIQTGNGFVKTWWDDDAFDDYSNQNGCIRYASIKPFELFVPDLRERTIEGQPFLTIASIRPVEWVKRMFQSELNGVDLTPSVGGSAQIVEDGALRTGQAQKPDSCIIYETWIKPGVTPILPSGGLVLSVDDQILRVYPDGLPYPGGKFPITKFENVPTGTFYADSSLNDTNSLQRSYNKLWSDLSASGSVFGQPHVLAQKGSIVPSRIQNVAGQVIEYEPGTPPPTAMPMPEVPTYYVNQIQGLLNDFEDISGMRDVATGQTPPGVTSGTAINFLAERVDGFFSFQLSSIEWGIEDLARKGLALFQQYIDLPRAIKVVGMDKSYDVQLLKGSDITKGTDVRVEVGSGQVHSQAAEDAKVLDLWAQQVIQDPHQVLKLLRVGGTKQYLDVFDAAEAKAERENIKMRSLTQQDIMAWQQQNQMRDLAFEMQQMLTAAPSGLLGGATQDPTSIPQMQPPVQPQPGDATDPTQQPSQQPPANPGDPTAVDTSNPLAPPPTLGPPPPEPIIPVDDFDVHEKHIVVHNTYRMTQEYELLPPEIKQQFEMHVQAHKNMLMRQAISQFTQQIPSDGTDPNAPQPQDMSVDTGAPGGNAGSISGNGVVPHPTNPAQGG